MSVDASIVVINVANRYRFSWSAELLAAISIGTRHHRHIVTVLYRGVMFDGFASPRCVSGSCPSQLRELTLCIK